MILTTEEAAEKYKFTPETMRMFFKTAGSPAFRLNPDSKKSVWRVDDEKLEKFLLKISEQCKG